MEAAEKFAVVRASGRYWTVAAIHGDADRLTELHVRLTPKLRDGDKLIYLGNFLGLGHKIVETVNELLLYRRRFLARRHVHVKDHVVLRGAQEEMWQKLMQIHLALDPAEVIKWMVGQGAGATVAAYGASTDDALASVREGATALNRWAATLRDQMRAHDGHAALLAGLRRAAYSDDGGMLFVHAGLDPAQPIVEQADDFWWNGDGFDQIRMPYGSYRRIVRGYDRRLGGVQILDHTATIDGGCGRGGPLVAACFDPLANLVDVIEV